MRQTISKQTAKITIAIVSVIVLVILTASYGRELIALNLLSLDAAHRVLSGQSFTDQRWVVTNKSHACSAHWMESFVAADQGDIAQRNQAYQKAAACDPDYVIFLHTMYPTDLEMAKLALNAQANSAEGWFWTGDLIPEKMIEYYRQGLTITPTDGRRWIALGDALAETDAPAALQAYLQGCHNGDPGYNGCGRAGSTAEKLGLYEEAIQYYLLSSYPPFRQRGLDLEQKILSGK